MSKPVTSSHPETSRCGFCWLIVMCFLLLSLLVAGWLYLRVYGTQGVFGDKGQELSALLHLPLQPSPTSQYQYAESHTRQQYQQTIAELEQRLSASMHIQQVDKTTNRLLRGQLLALEGDLEEAKRRLLVYEAAFSNDKLQRGLRVQHFGLRPILDPLGLQKNTTDIRREYHYHLVLVNAGQDGTPIKGAFEIMMAGWRDNNYRLLVLADLRKNSSFLDRDSDQQFVLKYYQSFEGDIRLPEGFLPEGVIIELYPGLKRKDPIVQRYDWAALQPSDNKTTPLKQE